MIKWQFVVIVIADVIYLVKGTDLPEARSGKNILQALTKIDLGAQSQLLANPGSTVQIHYEITNLRDVPTFHNFQVIDERSFLRSLTPVS